MDGGGRVGVLDMEEASMLACADVEDLPQILAHREVRT